MPAPITTMSVRHASLLAERLASRGMPTLAEQVALLEVECQLAARLIRAMLRQVHSSDVFRLPPEE
jgi:hypothetical protein